MSHYQPAQRFSLVHTIRRYLVSAFVVFSFVAYAIHERYNPAAQNDPALLPAAPSAQTRGAASGASGASGASQSQNNQASSVPSEQPSLVPQVQPSAAPLPTDVPPVTALGRYRDGAYTGNIADAVYGPLQVKAIIQGGKLTDVQVLDYPHDRRTSQNINRQALPYLRYEAIQAQNAQIDIISGATLTSQAYAESLQAALNGAAG